MSKINQLAFHVFTHMLCPYDQSLPLTVCLQGGYQRLSSLDGPEKIIQ